MGGEHARLARLEISMRERHSRSGPPVLGHEAVSFGPSRHTNTQRLLSISLIPPSASQWAQTERRHSLRPLTRYLRNSHAQVLQSHRQLAAGPTGNVDR